MSADDIGIARTEFSVHTAATMRKTAGSRLILVAVMVVTNVDAQILASAARDASFR